MLKPRKVRIFKRGDRGFHQYGEQLTTSYGEHITVYESSSAVEPHVWLQIQGPVMTVTAHLNKKQAEAVIARLQTWIEEIPGRWGGRRA